MKDSDKGVVVFAVIATIAFSVLAWAYMIALNPAAAPNGRRWPVTTGMELPMVNILDENGYYSTLACKVTAFDNDAHTYVFACGDAPAVITVGQK